MSLETKKVEELFLKIFKVAVLAFMTLALIAVLGLAVNAIYQASRTPVEPAPAAKAPQRGVDIEELKKSLLRDGSVQQEPQKLTPPESLQMPPSLLYLEDVTKLYRCSVEFAKRIGAEIAEPDNATTAQRVEALREKIEELASNENRGHSYVKNSVEFTCTALAEPTIVAARKAGHISNTFLAILNYHLKTWDSIEKEREEFEQAEATKVATQKAAETLRVQQAHAEAVTSAVASAVAFGVFMLLALYLLGAKIETNLREISSSARFVAVGRSRVASGT